MQSACKLWNCFCSAHVSFSRRIWLKSFCSSRFQSFNQIVDAKLLKESKLETCTKKLVWLCLNNVEGVVYHTFQSTNYKCICIDNRLGFPPCENLYTSMNFFVAMHYYQVCINNIEEALCYSHNSILRQSCVLYIFFLLRILKLRRI